MSDRAGRFRRAGVERLGAFRLSATRWVASASYVRKWVVLGIAIGVIAGCGAIVFYEALHAATALFLQLLGRLPDPDARSARATSCRLAGRHGRGRCR